MKTYHILYLTSESPEVIEQLGSKDKFWFLNPEDDSMWLFKFARPKTGEDWAEKVASEIAKLLEIPAATVELAEFCGKPGAASRRFHSPNAGEELLHGSEVMAGHVPGYDRQRVRGLADHTVHNIVESIKKNLLPENHESSLTQLAGYLFLDGLIGNMDRHHDNWALLKSPGPDGISKLSIAPSYDHASALGRELLDVNRIERLKQSNLGGYVGRGSGGIYWKSSETKAPHPLNLALLAAEAYPVYFRRWLSKLNHLGFEPFVDVLKRVPDQRMSPVTLDFTVKLLDAQFKKIQSMTL